MNDILQIELTEYKLKQAKQEGEPELVIPENINVTERPRANFSTKKSALKDLE